MPAVSPTGRVEAVGSTATDRWTGTLVPAHLLQHPYRPFAAAEAAADRHRVASTAARLLRGYYEATTRATATRSLQGHYEAASYQATTRLLPGYYQESRARHLASSTAAAAQLVCRRRSIQQLGAGADDPHTARKISRRPFTTCRTSRPTPESTHATRP